MNERSQRINPVTASLKINSIRPDKIFSVELPKCFWFYCGDYYCRYIFQFLILATFAKLLFDSVIVFSYILLSFNLWGLYFIHFNIAVLVFAYAKVNDEKKLEEKKLIIENKLFG